MTESMRLQINEEEIAVKRFPARTSQPRWSGIYLHGAGNSNKERGDAICMELANRGIPSVAFDFSGWGESTNRAPGSIKKRIDEATTIIERLILPQGLPLVVMAFSMSGQVAIELLRVFGHKIRCLALFNPAIYAKQAISIPYGPEFSEIIRRPRSWRNADIVSAFDGYRGMTLLFRSELDDVIPPEVFKLIAQAAPADRISELLVEAAPHQLGPFLNSHPDAVARVADAIVNSLDTQEND
ncbi:alpha/beta hydrolase [Herbaspirillum sp. WKF16]|uniref:alpha/beta hydrolase n=1 Tax=Herbaspirillum sp. WKF16 TaxID=3028312 RepID=UPI0023A96523|nr:alpha/beta hydrolase [Herbaspirillum sp. WKF16]WDZ96970.1 alpha/beta hydrolase [Herbaspirillum sp. WKF16]